MTTVYGTDQATAHTMDRHRGMYACVYVPTNHGQLCMHVLIRCRSEYFVDG